MLEVSAAAGSSQQSIWLKLSAPLNMLVASVMFETSQGKTLPLNEVADRNMLVALTNFATDQLPRSRLKEAALLSMESIWVTPDTAD